MSKETRMDLVRAFEADLVYIRTPFPMGKQGLTLKDGNLSPSGSALDQLMAMWGPAVKPGDQARISNIAIKEDHIRFEINGGPIRKQKWYQRVQISGNGGSTPIAPSDADANPRGSYVDLYFDHYVPEIGPQELKQLLRPVFDFDSKSPLDAFLETVPPKVKEAIQNHQVLVGMNREMVTYAMGRPPRKIREKDGDLEYEEWIYGEPPDDVNFIRLVGDEVVRVETMKLDGTKLVKTEKEIEIQPQPTVAQKDAAEHPANAPTLRRPGEDTPDDVPGSVPRGSRNPSPPAAPPTLPDPNPGGSVPN
jgi:hypothetical protein